MDKQYPIFFKITYCVAGFTSKRIPFYKCHIKTARLTNFTCALLLI
nr:MAG TPA: hypothetical protein [Caudoviricetes sp.]